MTEETMHPNYDLMVNHLVQNPKAVSIKLNAREYVDFLTLELPHLLTPAFNPEWSVTATTANLPQPVDILPITEEMDNMRLTNPNDIVARMIQSILDQKTRLFFNGVTILKA